MKTATRMQTAIHMTSLAQQLGLLYLSSPALPIGAFAYSQGLEKAIELNRVHDRESLKEWALDVIQFGLCKLEGPILIALSRAIEQGDTSQFEQLDQRVYACRETAELFQEEQHLGQSLARLLKTQALVSSSDTVKLPKGASFLSAFALAANKLGLAEEQMLLSFLWSWLENQITVSCKSIPLGQTDAQQVLLALRPQIARLIPSIEAAEQNFPGSSLPGQAMLSALHEVQYSRLFRS